MQSHLNPYVSAQALLERQLADWQHLLTQLQATSAPAEQITYCQRQTERLQAEMNQFHQ